MFNFLSTTFEICGQIHQWHYLLDLSQFYPHCGPRSCTWKIIFTFENGASNSTINMDSWNANIRGSIFKAEVFLRSIKFGICKSVTFAFSFRSHIILLINQKTSDFLWQWTNHGVFLGPICISLPDKGVTVITPWNIMQCSDGLIIRNSLNTRRRKLQCGRLTACQKFTFTFWGCFQIQYCVPQQGMLSTWPGHLFFSIIATAMMMCKMSSYTSLLALWF